MYILNRINNQLEFVLVPVWYCIKLLAEIDLSLKSLKVLAQNKLWMR